MYLAKLHSDSLTKDFRLSGFFNKRKIFETTSSLECLHYAQPVVHFKIDCETLPVCPRESVTARGPDPISLFSAPFFECTTLGIKFAGPTS
jgi:hypothetical protein